MTPNRILEVRHVVPADQGHRVEQDGACWCQPAIEEVPPNGRIYVHKELLALDIERLAMALQTYAQIGDWLAGGITPEVARDVAAKLAVEYDRAVPV